MSSAMSKLSFTLLVDALRRRPVGSNVAPVFFDLRLMRNFFI